jgi:predicted permease
VLSERLWRTHFGSDPSLVGRTVRLNEMEYDVVGILPASFYFPYEPQRLWTAYDPAQPPSGPAPRLDAFARLAPGVTREAAAGQVEARGLEIAKAAGGSGKLAAQMGGYGMVDTKVRNSVLALVGAVGFLLLIVCANLASLSLSRALSRSRDYAVRSALGASRVRLIREALTESLLLGMLGAAAGLLVAQLMLTLTLRIMPEAMTFSSLNEIDLDPRVLLFTGLAGVLTAVLFGLAPAILASRRRMAGELAAQSRSATGSRRSRAVRSSLIVAEVALSVVLLVGAALMTRSFVKLASVDNGFDPKNLIALRVALPFSGYADPHARYRFTQDFIERLEGMPGVTAVTAGAVPPDSDSISFGQMEFEGGSVTDREFVIPSFSTWPGYFDAVGIRIIEGRPFTADEPPGTVIVNEGFAAEAWPGESAVGKRMRWKQGQWRTVVGIAGEVRQTGVDEGDSPHEFYAPMRRPAAAAAPAPPPRDRNDPIVDYRTFVVRASDPAPLVPLLRAALREWDGRIAVWDIELVEHLLVEQIARPRLILLLMSVFGVMALVLSAAGIYGVLSMSVVQRLREIGVRIAMGATPRDVGVQILRDGLTLTGIGLGVGLAGSFYVLRFVRTLLFEVEPFDPFSVGAVALLLVAVAGLAAWRPARRAMQVDPAALLRSS